VTTLRIDDGQQRPLIEQAAAFFESRGTDAWLTGGYVRDALLSRATDDLDVSVNGDPLVLGPALAAELGGTYFSLQEERGHARILLPDRGVCFDLMPLRAPDIDGDLRLRDFTLDALGVALPDLASAQATIIDPTGGIADLEARTVRMTAERCFVDDPQRLLRGPRLANELGFALDAETATAIKRRASELSNCAPERQRDELMRLFDSDRASNGLRLLDELGLFGVALPEMAPARGVEQPSNHHYYDVLGHSFAAVEALDMLFAAERPASSPADELWDELWNGLAWCSGLRDYFAEETSAGTTRLVLLKFATLIHDIAKPQTRSIEADGRMRFFGHSDLGAEMATRLMQRLRFPTRETSLVAAMIEAHLRPLQLGLQGAPSRRAIYKFFRDTRGAGIDTLFLAIADHLGSVGPRVSIEGFRRHVALTGYILNVRFAEEDVVISPRKLLSGAELMAALGLDEGEIVGDLLEAVREAQAGGDVSTKEEALALARERLAQLTSAGRK
jgi:poly(A) polymerase